MKYGEVVQVAGTLQLGVFRLAVGQTAYLESVRPVRGRRQFLQVARARCLRLLSREAVAPEERCAGHWPQVCVCQFPGRRP